MTDSERREVRHGVGAMVGLGVAVMLAAAIAAWAAQSLPPPATESRNVSLVGYHDLQGREALQVTTRSDAANGAWVYVGHLDSFWDGRQRLNPITGQMEWNGTSILDVSDPARPRLVWHIPNTVSANSRATQVVYDYGFDAVSPKDYLARNSEADGTWTFQIFDITSRDSDPSEIALVGEISGTPRGSCDPGCGGPFDGRAHKGWWSPDTGRYYVAAQEPGFRSATIQIFDLRNPREPRFLGRAWLPGQKDGEAGYEGQYAHHPVVDEEGNRMYVAYRHAGHVASFDISDPTQPRLVWVVDTTPPGRSPHTASPIVYERVPNFGPAALPRSYTLVVDEAGGDDMMPCALGIPSKLYMLDTTHEAHPFPVSTWQVPVGSFCAKGGRFGPHQVAETIDGRLNRFGDKIAWIAYFNAGVRVLDLSNPYSLQELGHLVPAINANSHPMREGQPVAIQINDVDLDDRGLAYATDRAGTGLFILRYEGPQAP